MRIAVQAPLDSKRLRELRAGDMVKIDGVVYAARDAAHKRMVELIEKGETLPFDIRGQIIYYVGPCPAKPGEIIGSAGPTTSSRMDLFTPKLVGLGLKGMIGKGLRNKNVIDSMKTHGAIYFAAIGGAGALIARTVIEQEVIAFPDLGAEAVRRLTVKGFPAIVAIDSYGTSLYELGRAKYRILS
ncbi:MAG: Fe-S-containing hydro-lyase [Clostridium sp.]|nr:Fe-S-containing hydro-lyase [Clostridium sp.]